jgi:16S rRNA (cytidine1402-2'-O)-methyltransferase
MGCLYLVSTPIGNLADITQRAINTLSMVDYIVCEDTRRSGMLINKLNDNLQQQQKIKPQFISFYEEVEATRSVEILKLLNTGANIALISDAGTPLISDPGYKLISLCQKNNIKVVPIPGVSAVLAALVSSGLTANNFWFLGFLPSKSAKNASMLTNIKKSLTHISEWSACPTIVFFESPFRLKTTLQNILTIFGNTDLTIARELTKIHEEILTKKVLDWISFYNDIKPRGEYTLLMNIRP